MSQEAAVKFVSIMTWCRKHPDWYAQIRERYTLTEQLPELIRAAAENGYGEFTEQEYHKAVEEVQEAGSVTFIESY
jgi:hypothetical protein